MEKKRPHYDIATIKAEFSTPAQLRMTASGAAFAVQIGLGLSGVVTVIQSIERAHFYKSMTSHHDHRIWQDVYHVPHQDLLLYVKFTTNCDGFLLISFKLK